MHPSLKLKPKPDAPTRRALPVLVLPRAVAKIEGVPAACQSVRDCPLHGPKAYRQASLKSR